MYLCGVLLVTVLPLTFSFEEKEGGVSKCDSGSGSIYQFMVETLDGRNESMSKYKGNVLVVVNVATF